MKDVHFCIVFVMFSSLIFSQVNKESKETKNGVGLVVTDLVNGTYCISYERAIGEHFTANLGLGYKSDNGLIHLSGINANNINTNNITYSGLKIVPEFRYYIHRKQKTMTTGFYTGAYAKFVNYKSDISGTFIDSQDVSHDILYNGKIDVTSVGLMVGYKLPVSDRLNIDFLIAGPGAGFYKVKLNDKIPPPDEFYDALNSALEDYSLLEFFNKEFEFSETNLNEKITLPSFRYSISLGYSF